MPLDSTTEPTIAMHAYQPRDIELLRVAAYNEWRIKLYSISFESALAEEVRFTRGLELALRSLPAPARTDTRPGVGFCILHQGRGADYVVIGWWDRENELPLRVFVRTPSDAEWRPAQGNESVCVWDLQVIAFERDSYVMTILADPPRPIDQYLSLVYRTSRASPTGPQ